MVQDLDKVQGVSPDIAKLLARFNENNRQVGEGLEACHHDRNPDSPAHSK